MLSAMKFSLILFGLSRLLKFQAGGIRRSARG